MDLVGGPRVVMARTAVPPSDDSRAFVGVYTPYGTDRERIPGLAHFAEHLYANSPPGLEVGSVPANLRYFGSNATTRADFVSAWNVVNSEAAAWRLLARSASLWQRGEELDLVPVQLGRVEDELARSANAQLYVARRAVEHAFLGNRPPFSTELENLKALSPATLESYLNTAWTPSTSVLVIAGEIDLDEVEQQLRRSLSARPQVERPAAEEVARFFPPARIQEKFDGQILEVGSQEFEGILVDAGFETPPHASREFMALLVLDQILMGGRQEFSRLHDIRRNLDSPLGRELARRANIEYLFDGRGYGSASPLLAEADPALFHIVFYTESADTPEHAQAFVQVLDESLAAVGRNGLSEQALRQAKRELVHFYAGWLGHQDLRPLGDHLAGLAMHDERGPERLLHLHEEIEAVTLEEVRAVFQEYLVNGNRRIATARHDSKGQYRKP